MGVAFGKQPVHLPQSVLAPTPRAKTATPVQELPLKDRLDNQLARRLDDAVFDRRYPQGSQLLRPLGNLHPPHSQGLVTARLQRVFQFRKVGLLPCRKLLYALSVPSCRSSVGGHFLPRRHQRL